MTNETDTMQQADIRDATHVKLGDGRIEKIASKWGIGPDGRLAKPSEGGFGVVTETGRNVGMLEAHSYYKPMTTQSDADVALIRQNQCPACKNWGFIPGPRGGAGQNLYCANPKCRTAFMVAPRHNICMAERVGEAPGHYYPPQVHILNHGLPLCNFAGTLTLENGPPPRIHPVTPDAWPVGHSWVGREDFEQATCKACRERARS